MQQQQQEGPFVIESVQQSQSRSRNTRGEITSIRFHPLEEQPRPDLTLEALIAQLFDRVLAGHPPPMRVSLQVHPPSFAHAFTIPLRPPEQNTPAALAAAVERLNEISGAEIDLLSGATLCKILAVWPLQAQRGDGSGACDDNAEHVITPRAKGVMRVRNPGDRLCLARAVLLGLAHRRALQHVDDVLPQIDEDDDDVMAGGAGAAAAAIAAAALNHCHQQQHMHGPEARNLLRRAGISRRKHMYTLEDVDRLQQWLNGKHGRGEIRLVVFVKEQQYRIIYKGHEAPAARFNLCLYLEHEHFHYLRRPEQLFHVNRYCIDCEHGVSRYIHWNGCRVVCRLCMRYGADRPCQPQYQLAPDGTVVGNSRRMCGECGYVFPNDECFHFHLIAQRPNGQPMRSICSARRLCRLCGHVCYAWPGMGRPHVCRALANQQQQQQQAICDKCHGPHTREQPCFIQPLVVDEEEEDDQQQQQPDNDQQQQPSNDDDDEQQQQPQQQQPQQRRGRRRRQLPLRLCLMDGECQQKLQFPLRDQLAHKHECILIIAEVLCGRCIALGIGIEDVDQKAPNCLCGMPRGPQRERLCTPPFANAQGDESAMPNVPLNPRRLFFHSFDDDDEAPGAVDQFLDFLLNTGSRAAETLVLAHNGGKYDYHLILEALHRRNLPPKRICTTGLKIYSMRLGGNHQRKVCFKDTLNYFFCPLDALPKVFALPAAVATSKPFFPHLWTRRENLHIRLEGVPPLEHYMPDTMKAEKRACLLQWHQGTEAQQQRFQLREQLVIYCMNDVAILRESVLRFRRLVAEQTQGLDPFRVATTAAGLAMATMRRCFLPANKLVNSPEGGYLRGRRASHESRLYIRLFELMNPGAEGQIQCADWSIGEACVQDSGYRLDGLWPRAPPQRPLAIEYMGCFYHGCPRCFTNRHQPLAAGRIAEQLYELTVRRLWALEHHHGYELHVMWGCELKELLQRNAVARELWRERCLLEIVGPLDPREHALRGGRCEPFRLHYECGDGEAIICDDVVSLYPSMMKSRPMPMGNPRVLTREHLQTPNCAPLPWLTPAENIYRGLLYVRVLAPEQLRIPLLPYRTTDGRLTFPLCALCAERKQQQICAHVDAQRGWSAAYTHVELNKALELGYRVLCLHEVWHYDEWDDQLFGRYVNTFVGLKQQASGWPTDCDTPERRQAYVDDFERIEGIHLDPALVESNPGLRLIAKILANSLWGKMAQRVGHTSVEYTRTPAEFHRLLTDNTLDTLDFVHVSDGMDRVVVRKRPEFAEAPKTNCLPIAIFVTSYARLHLYTFMEEVQAIGAIILYVDTDSVYYVTGRNGPYIREGDALGQMKRELVGRRILEILFGGPKNYAYVDVDELSGEDEHACQKIRSFHLSYATQQLINFESMKALILEYFNWDGERDEALDMFDGVGVPAEQQTRVINVQFPHIGRMATADLYTYVARKQYAPCYEKGRIRPGMQTLPFGHRPPPLHDFHLSFE